MSEINDNDMDIKIGIDDSDVDPKLKTLEGKLDAFAEGVRSTLAFEVDDTAIEQAEYSLNKLTGISFNSLLEDLGELSEALMKLSVPDLSKIGNTAGIDNGPIEDMTVSLHKLQEALLKTASLSDLMEGDFVNLLNAEELTQAQNELTAYQASLHGVSDALRQQWEESETLGMTTRELRQIQDNLATAMGTVEARMEAVSDAMDVMAEAQGRMDGRNSSGMSDSFKEAGDAASSAAQKMGEAADAAKDSVDQLGAALSKNFTYESSDAMMRRKEDLQKFVAECQELIKNLMAQSDALRQTDNTTEEYASGMGKLQQSIQLAKEQLRSWKQELAYIEGQLEQATQAQQEYNNAANNANVNLPVVSNMTTPMGTETMQWSANVREASAQLQEAIAKSESLKDTMNAVGSAVKTVAKNAAEGAKKTTLWSKIVERMKKEWSSIGNMVKGIMFSQMFYKFTNAISTAINELKTFKNQLEETTAAFGLMMQDAEKGERLSNSLMNLAAETQLDFSQVSAATRKLQAYGFEAQNVEYILRDVADAAAASGDTYAFDRIILALGQINTKGKIAGEEINQLAEAGLNVRKYLSEGLGVTNEQLTKLLRTGISAEVAIPIVLKGIEKDYSGAAETISETMTGLASTVKDNFLIIGSGMLDPFFEATKDLLKNVRDVMDAWRQIVVDRGFGALLETLFPKSFVDQIRLFIANLNALRSSVITIIQALLPFLQSLINVGLVIANTILPVLNLFLTILARGIEVIAQNETAVRILTASFMGLMVAKAVTFVMTNFLSVVDGVVTAAVWAAKGLKTLGGMLVAVSSGMKTFSVSTLIARLAAGDFTAAIAALLGITTALVFSSEKASQAMANMMGSLTKSLGYDFNKIYQPEMEDSSAITDEFNQALGISDEALQKLGESAEDAGKQAKKSVAAFDEVFTLAEPDEDSSGIDLDLSGLDFDIPEIDYSGLTDGLDDVQEELDKKAGSFWDTWLGKTLKGLWDWIWQTIGGFLDWVLETTVLFARWAYDTLKGFYKWYLESIAGFLKWAAESLAGFGKWISESIAGFDAWFRESLDGFLNWVGESIRGFDDWARESLDGFAAWCSESWQGFSDWIKESAAGFADWIRDTDDGFRTWADETAAGFADWASETWKDFSTWFSDTMSGLGDWLAETDAGFADWWDETAAGFATWASDTWATFETWLSDSLAGFTDWASESWEKFTTWISDSAGGFSQWASDTWTYFSDWSNWTKEGISSWASDTWSTFTTWMSDSLGGFGTWAQESWGQFTTWTSESAAGFVTWASETKTQLESWISDTGKRISDWASNAWDSFNVWVSDTDDKFREWADDTGERFTNWASDSYDKFTGWASDTYDRFDGWVNDTSDRINNWATDTYDRFTTWASDSYDKFDNWVNDSADRFNTWATDTYEKFTNWASDSYNKFDNWVNDTADRFNDWASDSFKKFSDWVKNTLKGFEEWDTKTNKRIVDWINGTVKAFSKWVTDVLRAVGSWASGIWNAIIGPLEKVWKKVTDTFNDIGKKVSSIWNSGSSSKTTRTVNIEYDDPGISTFNVDDPDPTPSPLARIATPIAPRLTNLVTPQAPNVDEAISSSSSKRSSTGSFAGIGKEIAEYLLPALANNTGTQEQLPPVYVGTLIADDRGLRELERKMQVIRLQEGGRKG